MSVGHAAARGWAILSDSGAATPFAAATFGLATALVPAAANAQQAPAQQLPPIVVEGQTKAPPAARKKSSAAPKAAPKRQRAAQPAPIPVEAPVVSAPPVAEPSTFSTTPASGNTLESGTGIARLPGTVRDTPQVVNVIPQEQIQQQNATSVDQVLRNVPGITVAIGEGGGGFNGDQFRVRGFEAKGDIYVDGLRDFGVYVRDSFALEDVSVIKGPSSETFGSGTTGGVISLRQKAAHLGDAGSVEASIGTGMMYRTVIDINRQVSEHSAVRAVGMYHNQDIVDRDHVFSNRWGFLGSIALGLKTDTTWVVNYMHQTFDRMPDYGVPMVAPSGATRGGLPVTELGVGRSTFYGRSMDHDEGTADMITSRLQHKLNQQVTFYNDTRFAFYQRDFSTTVPQCSNATPGGCADEFLAGGNPLVAFGGGNPTYKQDVWGVQNVTSMVAKFHTGRLRHEAVAGLDVFYQEDDRPGWSSIGKVANSTIRNPGERFRDTYSLEPNPVNYRYGSGSEVGLFASDRIWLLPQFSVLAGVRWTNFESAFNQPNAATPVDRDSSADYTAPKVSLIWEPTKQQTYYASWATAATPVGQFVTNSLNPIGSDAQENLLEEHESWEVGAKYSLLNGKLGLTAAAFEVTKNNAAATDPATGLTVLTGEVQRVRGIELGVAGSITPAWTVNAGYAYLDSEILESATPTNIGNRVGGVPEHSASLWTTYNLSKHFVQGPGEWLVGAGVRYQGFMYAANNSANLYGVPDSVTFDALVSYELNGWRAAVNGYNLTDELYYDATFNNRAIPAAGRAVVLTISKKF